MQKDQNRNEKTNGTLTNDVLIRINRIIIYTFLALFVFHPFMTKLINFYTGIPLDLLKSWKEILILILGITTLILYYKKIPKLFDEYRGMLITLGVFGVVVIFSFFNNQELLRYILGLREYFQYILMFLLILLNRFDKRFIRNSLILLLSVSAISSIFGIIQFFNYEFFREFLTMIGTTWVDRARDGVFRINSFTDNSLHLASFHILPIFVSLVFLTFKKISYKIKILLVISLILNILTLLFTLGRGPLLSFFVGLFFLMVYRFHNLLKDKRVIIGLVIFCMLIIIGLTQLPDNYKKRFTVDYIKDDLTSDTSRPGRWKAALDTMDMKDLIIGKGLGYYGPSVYKVDFIEGRVNRKYISPRIDSAYLKLLYEVGIIGLVTFIAFLIYLGKKGLEAIRRDDDEFINLFRISVFTFFVSMMFFGLLNNIFDILPTSQYMWIFYGMILVPIEKKNILKGINNTVILVIGETFVKIFNFIIIIILTRSLGPEKFGVYGFALSFGLIFYFFIDFGFNKYIIRESSRDFSISKVLFSNIFLAKLIFSAISLIIIYIYLKFFGYDTLSSIVTFNIFFYLVFETFSEYVKSFMIAKERMIYPAVFNPLKKLVLLIIIILLLQSGIGLVGITNTMIIISGAEFLLIMILLFTRFFKPQLDFSKTISVIKRTVPFALSIILVQLYFRIDTVMLSVIKGQNAVGLYTAPYLFVFALQFIPNTIMLSVYPKLSRYFKSRAENAKKELKKLFINNLLLIAILSLAISIIVTIGAGLIVQFLFGDAYFASVFLLQILIWAVFFSFISHVFLYTLNAVDKTMVYTKIVSIALVLNIILNLVLIPNFSIYGAALSTLITEGFGCVLLWYRTNAHL
jgi:O-antigen/teichoic acid export membrane protein